MLQRQSAYSDEIVAWLGEHMPEFVDDHGKTDPDAWVAVWRLQGLYGRGQLTVEQHGDWIREFVRRRQEQRS